MESKETGFDRVKRMYTEDTYGLLSPEMHYLVQSVSSAVLVSAVLGAVTHMHEVKNNFFRQNVASTYDSQHLARRKLVDTMTLNGARGAIKYAFKYGSFSSLYLMSTMTVANYNNKITVWEHIGSGAVLGGLFRINFGLKGMFVAASVGSILGLFAGGILVSYMQFKKVTLDDLRNLQSETYYKSKRTVSKDIA